MGRDNTGYWGFHAVRGAEEIAAAFGSPQRARRDTKGAAKFLVYLNEKTYRSDLEHG